MRARTAKLFSPLSRAGWLLVIAVLAWLAARNAAIALFAQVQPSFALALPPPSGEALAIQAMSGRSSAEQQQVTAQRALTRSPVSYWPVVAAAEAALRQGDEERGVALLEAAVRRNSRQADTRGRLFQLYISQGRWSEGIDEGLAYGSLRNSMADSVMEGFLLLLDDVRGRAILARKLQARADGSFPPWRERLVRLSAGRPGERRLAALLSRLETEPAARDPAEVSMEGYISWVGTLPDEALPHVRGVYDGEFRQLAGAAPFNWGFSDRARVEAGEEGPGGVIVAQLLGAQPAVLARQVLVLSPGPHRLAVDGRMTQGSGMVWRISCLSGTGVAELPLPPGSQSDRAERAFTVPAGCPFQELALIASGGGGASQTSRVAIRPGL